MSFILDALKKSETDRQRQGGAEFSAVPVGSPNTGAPRWLWALATLLILNVVALSWLLLRPTEQPQLAPVEAAQTPQSAPGSVSPDKSFEQRVAEARARQPVAVAEVDDPAPQESQPVQNTPRPPAPRASTVTEDLPTLLDLRARGELLLPDLHLDIHVYSEKPADRFVFINMSKHREGSSLAEGPRVEEITADGVVFDYRGRRFKLPRE